MYWSNEDTFYMKYKESDILQYWGSSTNIHTLKSTYPNNFFVLSPVDYYYLDCGYGNKYGGNSWCDPMKTFWQIYQFEPSDYLTDSSVLGGEGTAWSELFNEHNIHSRLWPRAAAIGDKLWSDKVPTNLVEIKNRLDGFADYLNGKGIATSPITCRYCEINDYCFEPVNASEKQE
jgi:hexosaminidase